MSVSHPASRPLVLVAFAVLACGGDGSQETPSLETEFSAGDTSTETTADDTAGDSDETGLPPEFDPPAGRPREEWLQLWRSEPAATDRMVNVEVAADGRIFAVGHTFREGPEAPRAMVWAYSPFGELVWAHELEMAADEAWATGLALSPNGPDGQSVYVSGSAVPTEYPTGRGFFAALDREGVPLEPTMLFTSHDDPKDIRDLAVDPTSGEIWAIGTRDDGTASDDNPWYGHLHVSGNLFWDASFEYAEDEWLIDDDVGRAIALGDDGTIYLAGASDNGGLDGWSMWASARTREGEELWSYLRTGPGNHYEEISDLVVGHDGQLYGVGSMVNDSSLSGRPDAAIVGIDATTGEHRWMALLDGGIERDDWAYGIVATEDGLVVSGETTTISNEGCCDTFIAEYNYSGNHDGTYEFNYIHGYDNSARALALTPWGGLVAVGHAYDPNTESLEGWIIHWP